jgi:hypothetical protein
MRTKDWSQAVESFRRELNVDVAGEYERLKEMAKIPAEKLTDSYFISVQINNASKNAHIAFLMFLKARREAELFEIEYMREMRELTRLSMARITSWMEGAKLARKQITQAMIQEEIAAGMDTRERYSVLSERRQELHDIRDAMQNFSQMWADRRSSLQTQAQLAKSKKEVLLGGGK